MTRGRVSTCRGTLLHVGLALAWLGVPTGSRAENSEAGEPTAEAAEPSPPQPPPEVPEEAPPPSYFQRFDASYLYGFNFDLGPRRRDTITLQYAGAWAYGDNFAFVDVLQIAERPGTSEPSVYAEWSPRVSLSALTGHSLAAGPLADVLLAGQLNATAGFFAHLWGAGVALAIPGFAFAQVNAYVRDDIELPGVTWQVTLAWQWGVPMGRAEFIILGFADLIGEEGGAALNFLAQVQVLVDLGGLWGHPGRLRFGCEMLVWRNEYGIDGQHEAVPQAMIQLGF